MTKKIAVLQIRLAPEELEEIRNDARTCGHSIAEHVRQALLKPGTPHGVTKPVADRLRAQIPDLKIAAELPKPTRAKVCVHGTPKGYNCWQCRGLAKVESAT